MARFTEERMFEKLGDISSSKKTRINKYSNGGQPCPEGHYWNGKECLPYGTSSYIKIPYGSFQNPATLPSKPNTTQDYRLYWQPEEYAKEMNNTVESIQEGVDWYKDWYSKRKELPQFAEVAQKRLDLINDPATTSLHVKVRPSISIRDGEAANYYQPYKTKNHPTDANKVIILPMEAEEDRLYFGHNAPADDTLIHEFSHFFDHFARQPRTSGVVPRNMEGTINKFVDPSGKTLPKDLIFNEIIPQEYRTKKPADVDQSMWDHDMGATTEMRAALNEWRLHNNIDPLKDYSIEEIEYIMKNGWSGNSLLKILRNDPALLKKMHDSYVSIDSDKELDMAQYGGIAKYPDGGLVQLDRVPGARFKKNSSGTWVYESGAPITDQLILQELNYGKGKPVGSPVMQGAPAPDLRTTDMKIKAVKNQGMAYQSTADQLKPLQQQKAKEVAQQKAEQDQLAKQSFERTVGLDNTSVTPLATLPQLNKVNPAEQVLSYTKAYKDAARDIISKGHHLALGIDKEYLSKENSHRPGGPLSMEEILIEKMKKDPNFFQNLEKTRIQQFRQQDQKAYDAAPWYIKAMNDIAAFAADPITTTERAVFEFQRPLMGQALQSLHPEEFQRTGDLYDKVLRRDENTFNNLFNYVNPMRYAASAGYEAAEGNYGDAALDFGTAILAGRSLPGLVKGTGRGILNVAKQPIPGLAGVSSQATIGNAANIYFGQHALTENLPNAISNYAQGNFGEGNRELFYTALGVLPVLSESESLGQLGKDVFGKMGIGKAAKERKLINEISAEQLMKLTPEQELILEKLSKTNPDYNIRMVPLFEEDITKALIATSDDMKMGSKTNLDAWPSRESSESLPLNRTSQKQAFDDATAFSKEWVLGENVDKYDQLASARSSIETVMPDVVVQRNLAEARYKDLSKKFLDPNESKIIKAKEEWLRRNGYDPAIMSSIPTDPKIFELLKDLRFGVHNDEIYRIIGETDPNLSVDLQRVFHAQKKLDALNNTLTQLHDDAKFIKGEFENLQVDPRFEDKVNTIYKEATPDGSFYRPTNTGSNISGLRIESRPKLVYPDELEPSFMEMTQSDKDYIKKNLDQINGARTSGSTFTLGSRPQSKSYLAEATPIEGGQPIYSDVTLFDMRTPEEAAGTNAHEIGHDFQKLFKGYDTAHAPGDLKNILEGWIDLLQKYDKEDYGYYIPRDDNPIARMFKDALVDPVKKAPGSDEHDYDTWLSGPGELHSDLMKARYELVKHLQAQRKELKQDTSLKATVEFLKDNEDYYLEWLSEHDVINRHFKSTTDPDTKKLILKYLPMLVPAVGAGAAASMGDETLPENKYGGNIKNLSKFIRK